MGSAILAWIPGTESAMRCWGTALFRSTRWPYELKIIAVVCFKRPCIKKASELTKTDKQTNKNKNNEKPNNKQTNKQNNTYTSNAKSTLSSSPVFSWLLFPRLFIENLHTNLCFNQSSVITSRHVIDLSFRVVGNSLHQSQDRLNHLVIILFTLYPSKEEKNILTLKSSIRYKSHLPRNRFAHLIAG